MKLVRELNVLFSKTWNSEEDPSWEESIIVPTLKKSFHSDCDNHKDIN